MGSSESPSFLAAIRYPPNRSLNAIRESNVSLPWIVTRMPAHVRQEILSPAPTLIQISRL